MLLPFFLAIDAAPADADLVARLQRRDPRALGNLYDRYGRLAFSLILRIVRDPRVAEDLVQETFLHVWNRVHALDLETGAIGPWLLAVARNRAIDYVRPAAGRDDTNDPTLYNGVSAALLLSDAAARARAAVRKLPPNERQVLDLSYFEGLSESEIAGRLDQPSATVKTWIAAAYQTLRGDLGVADTRELAALVGASADPAAPSPKLRRRILASAGHEQRRFGWAPWLGLLAALALFAAFYFSTRERQFAIETVSLREQMRRQAIDLTRLNEAFSILSAPGAVVVSFDQGPNGKLYVDRSRGVLLIAIDLPPAPAGKLYEMWTIPRGGKPTAAGLFQSAPAGVTLHLQPGPVDPNLAAVSVTLEDQSGAMQPTSAPIISASLDSSTRNSRSSP